MSSADSSLSVYERQTQIALLVNQQQRVNIAEICEAFSISMATARRDLKVLEEDGAIKRFHGGAIAVKTAPPEPPLSLRSADNMEEKRDIGRLAATLVKDGDTVFLGSGTTVLEVAHNLRDHQNLTVITNSLMVLNALAGSPGLTLVCLGGILRVSEMSFIGHLTEQALTELRVTKTIMGIHAIDIEHGLTNDYLPETQTDRTILEIGQQVILVADYTKCKRISTAFLAPITAVDVLVTDRHAPADFLSGVVDKEIQVLVASGEENGV